MPQQEQARAQPQPPPQQQPPQQLQPHVHDTAPAGGLVARLPTAVAAGTGGLHRAAGASAAGAAEGGQPHQSATWGWARNRRSLLWSPGPSSGYAYCVTAPKGRCWPCEVLSGADPCWTDDFYGANSDVCMVVDVGVAGDGTAAWYPDAYGGAQMCPGLPVWRQALVVELGGKQVQVGHVQAWEDTSGFMVVTLRLDCPWYMWLGGGAPVDGGSSGSGTGGGSLEVEVRDISPQVGGGQRAAWRLSSSSTQPESGSFPARTCSSFRFPVRQAALNLTSDGGGGGSGATSPSAGAAVVVPGAPCEPYNRQLVVAARLTQLTATAEGSCEPLLPGSEGQVAAGQGQPDAA
ncbi:hypothetical protein HYH02_014582 [Chlamydomonas schloesseri]|uniref:Uncharacterized protein n=1 Tax=Chlamydomonas schloesseri TaxID=2026947 RepID=A0A835SX82_9CHLO|nr:hypothetical protein HYH02_014582 [Chlamydomonas schloesseri]|eukprot:KAG2427536.1 hypothetical protein HYH02_014582 [Chlamydomonas schloesseri]